MNRNLRFLRYLPWIRGGSGRPISWANKGQRCNVPSCNTRFPNLRKECVLLPQM